MTSTRALCIIGFIYAFMMSRTTAPSTPGMFYLHRSTNNILPMLPNLSSNTITFQITLQITNNTTAFEIAHDEIAFEVTNNWVTHESSDNITIGITKPITQQITKSITIIKRIIRSNRISGYECTDLAPDVICCHN